MDELIDRLITLAKRPHYSNQENPLYSCPKSGEGITYERGYAECVCGADKHNELVDDIAAQLRKGGG
jgi:hypothetical protein